MMDIATLVGLRADAEWSMLAKRGDTPDWMRAWKQRSRWDARWKRQVANEILAYDKSINLKPLITDAQRSWGGGFLRKKRRPENAPTPEEVEAGLRTQVNEDAFAKGAMAFYLSLSLEEGEDSGQATLDSLGLHDTFTWADVESFAKNPFAIHGSKILTRYYDRHLDRLAQLVLDKCDPRHPKTMGQLTKEIRQEWDVLTRKEASRIARTESAFVWETTNWNAMALNNVPEIEWLVATGPNHRPICKECLKKAALGPYVMEDMEEIPPLHPHCACTVIPRYDPTWLPPSEPWTGAARKMAVFT